MSQPPNWGPPPPPQNPRESTGLKHAVKKSFTDWGWIRRNPTKSIPILLVAAFVLSAVISALADPNTYKGRDSASGRDNPSSSASHLLTSSAVPPPESVAPSTSAEVPSSVVESIAPKPKTSSSPRPNLSATPTTSKPTAVTYPGKTDDDVVAGADRSVRISGFTMTLGPLKRVRDKELGYDQLCSTITLLNRDTKTQSYYDGDFSIQYPNGNVKGTQLAYSGGIGSGALVHNGSTHGRVCFVPDNKPGLHIVTWEPDLDNYDRAVWLFRLK